MCDNKKINKKTNNANSSRLLTGLRMMKNCINNKTNFLFI